MQHPMKALAKLIRRMRIPWLLLVVATVFALVETAASLWVPLITRDLIGEAGAGIVPRPLIVQLVIVILGQAIVSGVGLYLLARAGEIMTADLREQLVERLLQLPMPFHDEAQSGELTSRAMSDTVTVKSLLTVEAVGLLASILAMIGAIVILWVLDWRLTLVLFGCSLAGLLLILPIASRLTAIGKDVQDGQAKLSGRLAGVLAEMRLVKASSAEQQELARASGSINDLKHLGYREARIMAALGPTMTLAMSGAMVAILGYGGARVGTGTLTVGTLVAFILYLFQVVVPMIQLSTFAASLSKAAGAAAYLSDLLDEAVEDRTADGPAPPKGSSVTFDRVAHAYGDADEVVLDELSLEIPAGKMTALVGPSGSGKTTVLSLIERFYAPRSGSIFVGGLALGEIDLAAWRRSIGYVPQEAPLLAGTVRENLCLGLTGQPSEREINDALAAARANDFVGKLPDGLDTEVGERGVKLSGGQRQRLAIARAFLTNPDILMLDEATANLDAESEEAIRAALADLTKERTTLVVAHRLSTVREADQIAIMESGKVTGLGRHEELISTHDVYRDLVEKQSLEDHRLTA